MIPMGESDGGLVRAMEVREGGGGANVSTVEEAGGVEVGGIAGLAVCSESRNRCNRTQVHMRCIHSQAHHRHNRHQRNIDNLLRSTRLLRVGGLAGSVVAARRR